jgi:hypothetical protein
MRRPLKFTLLTIAFLMMVAGVNFAPMATPLMPGMKEYSFHGMRVMAKPADEADGERLAARIAKQAGAVTDALGMADSADIGMIVYPSHKDLHRKTIGFAGAFLPDWFIGDNTRDWVLITSPAKPGPAHSRESIEQAAVHEYVHVLTDRINKGLGYWLKEGIALYLAGQQPSPDSVWRYASIRWEEYSRPSALQFAEVGGYTLAYTLVQYITERYGWETVVRLIPANADMQEILSVGPRGLFDEWKAWLLNS